MKNKKIILVLISILLCTMLISFKSYAIDEGINKENQDILTELEKRKIDKFIEEQMDKGKVPGVSVVVVHEDKIIYENGFGFADIESKEKVTSKTLFEIGSNSKALTGLGILKLQEDGLINMNDEVTKYIPWLKFNYQGKEVSATIENFLYHTSGIPFNTIEKIPVSDKDNALEETVRKLIGQKLDEYPGEKFQYATINYDVLGLLIEIVSGVSYEEYMAEKVLKPLGLSNTYLFKGGAVEKDIATGYKIGFLKPLAYDAPLYRGNKPAGYIISNTEDMGKWLKIQLGTDSSSTFNKKLIEESHMPNRRVAPENDGSSYAVGWSVYQKGGGEVIHGGTNPNYSSYLAFRPEEKIGVAVLGNVNSSYVSVIGHGIKEMLIGKEYSYNGKDNNQSADKISILIIVITAVIIITTIFFMFRILIEIFNKKRKFHKKSIKNILKMIVLALFLLGVTYCIYSIPNFLMGLSWDFVFVWYPESSRIALYLVYTSIWLLYLYYSISSFYKKKDDKSLLILIFLSIVSGFGNSLVIFTINMAITNSNDMKVKLLIYFVLGIILYVYGQRILRTKLIDITNGIVYSKRMDIVHALLKTPYEHYEKIEKDRIQSTLNNDTERISRFVNILISGVTSLVTLICCFVYLGFVNKYALLLAILTIAIIASIYYLVGRYANKIGEQSRDLQNIFFKFINDLTGGFKELSLNDKKKKEFKTDMEISCKEYKRKNNDAQLAFANMFILGELMFTVAIGVIAFIFPLILSNLENADISSYVFILLYMTGPIHGILNTIPSAIEVRISFKRINELLAQIPSIEKQKENDMLSKEKLNLELNKVEYEYDNNEGRTFKIGPINCEFNSGEIIFITGGNGSGKSTLAKLISGLYKPSKGHIHLNGNEIPESNLNQQFTTIFSDFYLFEKLYGIDYKYKEKEIKKYLEILQLDEKVEINDGKFSTLKLSTGQKKRLALIVSYLEDKSIYLFDEWASDQDPEFRKFFYNVLLPEFKSRGKCIIAITHDDTYFNLADKVIKMDMGKIAN